MKKKSTLLNVISIILIVLSAFGLLGGIISLFSYNYINEMLGTLGMVHMPLWYYFVALIVSCIDLAAGIMGVMYRSKRSVLIIGTVYCLSVLASMLLSTVILGFSATYILDLILPALYMWGWYQSE